VVTSSKCSSQKTLQSNKHKPRHDFSLFLVVGSCFSDFARCCTIIPPALGFRFLSSTRQVDRAGSWPPLLSLSGRQPTSHGLANTRLHQPSGAGAVASVNVMWSGNATGETDFDRMPLPAQVGANKGSLAGRALLLVEVVKVTFPQVLFYNSIHVLYYSMYNYFDLLNYFMLYIVPSWFL